MLPTFIVIGAMKCGTTSLYRYLKLHPEIRMSSTKEPNFFVQEKNYTKGLNWYESLFEGSAKVYGECSTNYTKVPLFSGVSQRMYSVLPDIKLIYLLRDPIERIISHYIHNYAEGEESRSIYTVLKEFRNNKYISTSLYYFQLQDYLQHYSNDKILIVCSEELKSNRLSVLQKIFDFLEVDNTFTDDMFFQDYNQSAVKTRIFAPEEKTAHEPIEKGLYPFSLTHLEQDTTIQRPELDRATKERLMEYLGPDMEKLRQWTGQNFSAWCL